MGLLLGMDITKDNEIYIEDLRITIDKVVNKDETHITLHGAYMEEHKVITTHAYTRITQDCDMILSKDKSGNRTDFCKIVVEAPKHVKILRGDLYHRGKD